MTGKKRAPNFSMQEKAVLVDAVRQFKPIIENKKTDARTWRAKDIAWQKVTCIFNSTTPEHLPRSKESLRKCYDNIKTNLRKEISEEQTGVYGAGGGAEECSTTTENFPRSKEILKKCYDSLINTLRKEIAEEKSGLVRTGSGGGCAEEHPPEDAKRNFALEVMNGLNTYDWVALPVLTNEKCEHYESDSEVVETEDHDITDEHCYVTKQEPTPNLHKTQNWGNISAATLKTKPTVELQQRCAKRRRTTSNRSSTSSPPTLQDNSYAGLRKLKMEVYKSEKERIQLQIEHAKEIFNLKKKKIMLQVELLNMQLKKKNK